MNPEEKEKRFDKIASLSQRVLDSNSDCNFLHKRTEFRRIDEQKNSSSKPKETVYQLWDIFDSLSSVFRQ